MPELSSELPSASRRPVSSTTDTRWGFSPLTAEAMRWRIARTCCASSWPRTLSTIEAEGSGFSRENSARSGNTRCTRAACTRSMRADGARELALERAQVVDVLHEIGGAEHVGLVEDLVAHAAALGQPALGELHAKPRDAILGHQHDGAVVADLIGDALAFQVLDDGGGILGREVGEQRRHLRRRDAQDQEGEKSHERDGDRAHRDDASRTQGFQELAKSLHGTPRRPGAHRRPTRQELPGTMVSIPLMRISL